MLKKIIISSSVFLKITSIILFFVTVIGSQAQTYSRIDDFGELTPAEKSFKPYSKDLDGPGVVLYHRGHYKFEERDGALWLVNYIHKKTKVLDARNFDYGTVAISYYGGESWGERIENLKAVTHNGSVKTYVSSKDIYDAQDNTHWSTKRFAFPNIKDGSVIEYSYELVTPYFHHVNGWSFANPLPTLYSELTTEFVSNLKYSKIFYGDTSLDFEEVYIKKSCLHLSFFKVPGDCEVGVFIKRNVPAIRPEKHMLSILNYIPSLRFELEEFTGSTGALKEYTSSWRALNRFYWEHSYLGRELKHVKFAKRYLPKSVLSIDDPTERAKAVFHFIQNHITWTGQDRFLIHTDVKSAFKDKKGHSSEINLALINALEAGGIKARPVLLSTRNRVMPSQLRPVLNGFNYIIAMVEIGGEKILLDATEDNAPFGILPLRCINGSGRVLESRKESYWHPLSPTEKNVHHASVRLRANKDGKFVGSANEIFMGHKALERRGVQNKRSAEEKNKKKQSENEMMNISNFRYENEEDLDQPYKESFDFELYQQTVSNTFYLNPFLIDNGFKENMFKSDTRVYPIDLGYPMIENYMMALDLADVYEVVSLPENQLLRLPNDDGEYSVTYDLQGSTLTLRLSVRLNTFHYPKEANTSLSQFFTELVTSQNQTIELKRLN